jgi:hypothetical protein
VAKEFSVNPRLLLALLEYRGEWLTNKTLTPINRPIHWAIETLAIGLYLQLGRTANRLNDGYYGWKSRGAPPYAFKTIHAHASLRG